MGMPASASMESLARSRTVLIVDDDPDVVFTTSLILEGGGYLVLSGTSAADAAALTRSHRPALVLLDVEFPDGNGVDVARQIKLDPDLASVFVVLLSGKRITPEDQAEGLRSGLADGYIVRPLSKVDFLARIEAFMRIRAAQELLREKNAELERFNYTVSHDLKSPLVTIQGFAGLLEQSLGARMDERDKEALAFIRSSADRMYALLTDLLKFSSVGQVEYVREPVSLAEVARGAAVALLGVMTQQPIELLISDDLPWVSGDRARLHAVMQNLLENAVKYMGGQPAPRIEVGVAETENGRACFVRDNGAGIPLSFQEKAFGLFVRLSQDDKGTGVGLALVRRVIERHDGQVWIESAGEGAGTTVWFTLPWCER